MAKKGFLCGFPDGNFHPREGLTRAQAAAILCRIKGLTPDTSEASIFNDVPIDHWAAGYVKMAAEAGYLKGFPDKSFQPETSLTRAQGVSLFLRLSRQDITDAELPPLKDLNNSHWAAASVATALAAGMINAEDNKVDPDNVFSRGELARALSIMLTKDPDLSQVTLTGKLKVKSGKVTIKSSVNDKTKSVSEISMAAAGDTIITGEDGQAEITYPDGSGILLKNNSELKIKESRGRAYIKIDGTPGTGIDLLEVELINGKLFGALASRYTGTGANGAASQQLTQGRHDKIAARDRVFDLLAADGEKWYQTAERKKVKVKVDMPWGVAAIRGSFWSNSVAITGCNTTLLQGEAQVIAGGQAQTLAQGQSCGVTGQGQAPSPPAPMSPSQAQEWNQQKEWIETRAQEITDNQEAPPGSTGQNSGNQSPPENAPNLLNSLNQALEQAYSNSPGAHLKTSGSSGSAGTSSGTIVIGTIPEKLYMPVMFPGPMGFPVPAHIGREFAINPAHAQITWTETGNDVVNVSLSGEGTACRRVIFTCKDINTTGTETVTFNATAPGYAPLTKIIAVTVLHPLGVNPQYVPMSYSAPLTIQVNDSTADLWEDNESGISIQFIQAGVNAPAADINGQDIAAIFPTSVTDSTVTFELKSKLPPLQYEYIISKNGKAIAVAPLKVIDSPPPLTGFGLEHWVFSGYCRFSSLSYPGADHYLYRVYPDALPCPSKGEYLDTNSWIPAGLPVTGPLYEPGTPFPIAEGNHVNVAAVDASNQTIAYTDHTVTAAEIAQAPSDAFDTVPTFAPGIWVSSTHLASIGDSACTGGFKWIFQAAAFTGNTPAEDSFGSSPEFSGYLDCSPPLSSSIVLFPVQADYHLGVIGLDASGKVAKFIDHTLIPGEIANTAPAPALELNFSPGIYQGQTSFTVANPPSEASQYKIVAMPSTAPGPSGPAAPSQAAMGSDGSATGNAYTIGSYINGVAPADHIWVFALNADNRIVGFTDHAVTEGELGTSPQP